MFALDDERPTGAFDHDSNPFQPHQKTTCQNTSFFGTADGIRTHDLQSRSLALYPAELQPHILFAQTLQGKKHLV